MGIEVARNSSWGLSGVLILTGVATTVLASCGASNDGSGDNGASGAPVAPPVLCLPNEQLCALGCVDLSSNAQNCGACGMACAPGTACQAGTCRGQCGAGLGLCGGQCVSLQSSPNCGACGTVCPGGQSCVQGKCVAAMAAPGGGAAGGAAGSGAPPGTAGVSGGAGGMSGGVAGANGGGGGSGNDGCTDTLVTDLALGPVDVYQTVQIPLVKQGMAVATTARNADVVVGRKTLFRVYVTPGAGWQSRQVSARVELTDVDMPTPDQKKVFFAKLAPTAASTDADPNTTFQVIATPDAIGVATRYAVSLVECGSPPTTASAGMGARFPATGYQQLGAVETDILKVHIVPVGSPGPDTSDKALQIFKDRLMAVYPITDVQFTVGQPVQTSATSMCSAVATISSVRSQDNAPNDVYYYGLTSGILGGESGCSNASPSASGSKASVGWAQGYTPDDGRTGAATMCHELGHAHGRQHAPCNVQDPDPMYPYPDANTGVWGYDFRSSSFYDPMHKDMMSYCPEPRYTAWVSDYNYEAILKRVIAVKALPELPAPPSGQAAPMAEWRMLVSDSAGLHWIDEPLLVRGTPEGTPVMAVVHGESGPMQQVQVYKQELDDGVTNDAFMLTLPEPDPSWRAIEVPGILAPYSF